MAENTAPVAVVTGASAGVGRAVSVELARQGYDVALLARGRAGLDAAADEVRRLGRRALPVPTDVGDPSAVRAAADAVEAELGPIELWINDAMATTFAPSWELEPEHLRRSLEVTFLGQAWGTLTALERMRPRDRGTIVNVGSALAFVGIPLQSAYCASKFACRGFTESVRAELRHEGSNVRLSMVHLPAVNTPQFDWCGLTLPRRPRPVAPVYQPEVVARSIVAVALDGRPTKVVGAWNRLVVAAGRLAPGITNHFAGASAWDGQLTDEAPAEDRRDYLHHPVDDEADHGAHGRFDDEAGGTLDPSFLRSLPSTLRAVGVAVAGRSREAGRDLAARRRSAARLAGSPSASPEP